MSFSTMGLDLASRIKFDVWSHMKQAVARTVENSARMQLELEQLSKPHFTASQLPNLKLITWPVDRSIEPTHVGPTQDEIELLLYFALSGPIVDVERPQKKSTHEEDAELLLFFSHSLNPIAALVPQKMAAPAPVEEETRLFRFNSQQEIGANSENSHFSLPVGTSARRMSSRFTGVRPRSKTSKNVRRRLLRSSLRTFRNKMMCEEEWDGVIEGMVDELELFMLQSELPEIIHSRSSSCSSIQTISSGSADSSSMPSSPIPEFFKGSNSFDALTHLVPHHDCSALVPLSL